MKTIPVVTMCTLTAYVTDKAFIENIPTLVECDTIQSFDWLCNKYEILGITFVADKKTYQIKS